MIVTYVAEPLRPIAAERLTELLYEFDDCTQSEDLIQIQQQFTDIINTWGKKQVCKPYPGLCEIGEVVVGCSSSTSRRKRSEDPIKQQQESLYPYRASVTFDTTIGIQYTAPFDGNETFNLVNTMMKDIDEQIKEAIKNGLLSLYLEGHNSRGNPISYTTGSTYLLCEPGEEMDYNTFTCGQLFTINPIGQDLYT